MTWSFRAMANADSSEAGGKDDDNECSGFLRKKGRYSPKWSVVFAKVESHFLRYGSSKEVNILFIE